MFQPTPKQREALNLLSGDSRFNLLYGGTRSGKTLLLCASIVWRCRFPGSRHLIARLRRSHAETSIWLETLWGTQVPVLNHPSIRSNITEINRRNLYVRFRNNAEIWVAGFDDPARVEKILGHEYSTVFFNEVSQIAYDTFILARTRLAQNIKGLTNKAYLDCNPPGPTHWAHRLFIEKVDGRTKEPLPDPDNYASMLMNPMDNPHLAEDYIEQMLDNLPTKARERLKYGRWVPPEGTVFDRFNESGIVSADDIPPIEDFTVGIDFGLNPAAVLIGWAGDNVYVLKDYGGYNLTASYLNGQLCEQWKQPRLDDKGEPIDGEYVVPWIAYCDPSGGERIGEITNGTVAKNAVEPGLDAINTLIEQNRFFVSKDCGGVLGEIWEYRRDENGKVVKENDHYMDAMRYGIFSRMAQPLPRARWV